MVNSVWKIRGFFKENDTKDEYVNVTMLWRHVVSFVLYLLSSDILVVAFALYALFPNDLRV